MLPVSVPVGGVGRVNSPELRGAGYAMLPVSGEFCAYATTPIIAKPTAAVQPKTKFRTEVSPIKLKVDRIQTRLAGHQVASARFGARYANASA